MQQSLRRERRRWHADERSANRKEAAWAERQAEQERAKTVASEAKVIARKARKLSRVFAKEAEREKGLSEAEILARDASATLENLKLSNAPQEQRNEATRLLK